MYDALTYLLLLLFIVIFVTLKIDLFIFEYIPLENQQKYSWQPLIYLEFECKLKKILMSNSADLDRLKF